MIKNTIVEKLLREAVGICFDEYRQLMERKNVQIDRPPMKGLAQLDERSQERSRSSRLIPVGKWNDYHDYPKVGGLRHLIFFADTNGFKRCIRRVGRSVLIHEDAFFKWVEETNGIAKIG